MGIYKWSQKSMITEALCDSRLLGSGMVGPSPVEQPACSPSRRQRGRAGLGPPSGPPGGTQFLSPRGLSLIIESQMADRFNLTYINNSKNVSFSSIQFNAFAI